MMLQHVGSPASARQQQPSCCRPQHLPALPAAVHLLRRGGAVAPAKARSPGGPAAAAAASSSAPSTALALVRQCISQPNSVPAPAVLSALLELEAAKLPTDGWQQLLEQPGTHWRLIFTADAAAVKAAKKQQPNKGGIYFPIPAVQWFDGASGVFTNGVFLGPVAHLTFDGPFAMAGRQLTFDVTSMGIGLGPWRFSILLKKDAKPLAERDAADRKKLPFFLYSYIDRNIVVGRGRGGGLAVWSRADQEWEARAGVLQVYK